MLEFIVQFTDKAAAEKFDRYHGTNGELVRCRDCKSWEVDWKPNFARDGEHFCPMVSLVTGGHWFCADGERRDSDGTDA